MRGETKRELAAYLRKGHPHALHAFEWSLVWIPGYGFEESAISSEGACYRRKTWRSVLREIKSGLWA